MNKSIKAILLAAGFGTRLRPYTLKTPKCLINLDGSNMLEHWFTKLEEVNCSSVLVNTHYLAKQVENYIDTRENNSMRINYKFEPTLLGTAGTLFSNENLFKDSIGLLIHSDNAMEEDLINLLKAHQSRPKGCLLTMLTFESNNPQECGVVEINSKGIVQNFFEKVENPPCNIANGAVFVFDYELIIFLRSLKTCFFDFSKEVLPKLLGRIYTYHTSYNFIDIGNPNNLKKAQKFWAYIQNKN